MPKDIPQTPIAVRAICMRCEKTFSYYIWQTRVQTKASNYFETAMVPVCPSCRSRAVETDVPTNRSEAYVADKA